MEFKPRWGMPLDDNIYYKHYTAGGINGCIKVDGNSCLPNCVGYAHGRVLELLGCTERNTKIPACNAEDWFEVAKRNGFVTSNNPKLGAVLVWSNGSLHNSADGCGHVAVVEKIEADGTVWISESGYKTFYFKIRKLKRPYAYSGYKFLGFIYFDETKDTEPEKPQLTDNEVVVAKGDTLWSLAVKYLGSGNRYPEIMELNNLINTTIIPGMILKIPKR